MHLQITIATRADGSIDSATMTGEFQRRLAALQVAFTGEGTKVKLSKREAQATALGELLVPSRRKGRKVDPNSKFQRIATSLRKLLAKGEMEKDKVLALVSKDTGIPVATCAQNAMQVQGVSRNYGLWSLAST